MKAKKQTSKKRMIVLVSSVMLIAAIAAILFVMNNNRSTNDHLSNFSPPTKDEQAAADEQKDKNIEREQTDNSATPPGTASIVVVDASQYQDTVEVRAYISNIYEDNGKCTAVFTKDSQKLEESSTAFKDATTTQCGAINVPVSKFPSTGNWQMKLSYTSPSGVTGESDVKNIAVN